MPNLCCREGGLAVENLLNDLYTVQKKDFGKTGHVFGMAFKDDPSFHDIFDNKGDDRRDAFFEGPARYCYYYGKVYATSPEIEGLAAWVTDKYADMIFWKIVRAGLVKSSIRVGIKAMTFMRPIFEPLEKTRRAHMKERQYIYLMILGVDPPFQGKGYGGKLLRAAIEESSRCALPIYLETAAEKNVVLYRKFGFRVLSQETLPVIDIPMWCMIREPSDSKADKAVLPRVLQFPQ
jgi:ribosomal protein S18 acetylase RimI-like enzyme